MTEGDYAVGGGTSCGSADEGLQPERTELAWRRTVLSVAAVSLASARLLPELYGSALWVLPGVAGTTLAGFLWLASRRRHLHQLRAVGAGSTTGQGSQVDASAQPSDAAVRRRADQDWAPQGAALLAQTGGLVMLFGLGGLTVIIGMHLR